MNDPPSRCYLLHFTSGDCAVNSHAIVITNDSGEDAITWFDAPMGCHGTRPGNLPVHRYGTRREQEGEEIGSIPKPNATDLPRPRAGAEIPVDELNFRYP